MQDGQKPDLKYKVGDRIVVLAEQAIPLDEKEFFNEHPLSFLYTIGTPTCDFDNTVFTVEGNVRFSTSRSDERMYVLTKTGTTTSADDMPGRRFSIWKIEE